MTREVHLCESALGPMFEGTLLDGNVKPFRDFPIIAEMYLDGKFKLDELVLNRIALEDINHAFDSFHDCNCVNVGRAVIEFND
ncbi:hypothetical protein [Bacillus sp. sid0103]|uniref:hypothetical protein n=1 Tax=Bacillus sp. sid0103 TaxID=2856337 RepID=UPI00210867EA|nr:hypothetical protein [Bacillus sp. sid0103]